MSTIDFLPERLNQAPVVFRGLTTFEMFLALGAGATGGLMLGIPVAIAVGAWAVAPSGLLIGAMGLLLISGRIMARYKRGRSQTWLYRRVQMQVSRSTFAPLFSITGLSNPSLILRAGHWSIRRT